MANPRYRNLAFILVGTAVVTGVLGVYMLVVRGAFGLGAVLLAVALGDLGMAIFFSRRA